MEIRVYVDKIMIINFPGPEKWINMDKFANGQIRARKYRNRRIGELFKEIDLSEKQGTGIPKILRELKENGSPLPIFETDEDRTYLETTFFSRVGFEKQSMSELMSESMSELMSELEVNRIEGVLEYLKKEDSVSSREVATLLDIELKTASRLLGKAEKLGILIGKGKTKDKRYRKAE